MPANVEDLVKHIRLPVWPAWFGIVYILLDLITGSPKAGAWLEDRFGGRVCPMIWNDPKVSDPFLLVAHHRHSFAFLDPFRYVFRSILLPEGFPAHPHRGFETVTYILRGGIVHRDSYGLKKSYGAPEGADGSGEGGAVQWMTAGRGLQHEEMWRTGSSTDSTDQELFQIWVNLPSAAKMVVPRIQMLGTGPREAVAQSSAETYEQEEKKGVQLVELGEIPVAEVAPGVTVRVLSGEVEGVKSPVSTYSDVSIFHVTMAPGAEWSWPRPFGWTCILYTRRGEAIVGKPGTLMPVHHTARLDRTADEVALRAGDEGADLLVLAGAPLQEAIEMQGNMVMSWPQEIETAYKDLELGLFGPDWRHTLDDDDWRYVVRDHWDGLKYRLARLGAPGRY